MGSILKQLNINDTVFIQLALFACLYFILSKVYFKPFLKIIEARNQKTVADQERANEIMRQGQANLDTYRQKISEAREEARKDLETMLSEVQREKAAILTKADEEARKITLSAVDVVRKQQTEVKKQLEAEISGLADQISDLVMKRKH